MIIIRGTTPTLEYTFPFSTESLASGYVTIAQKGEIIMDAPLSDFELDGEKVLVTLTQEQTLSLDDRYPSESQITAKTAVGKVIKSFIVTAETGRTLKEGVV